MNTLKTLINQRLSDYPDFAYYLPLIDIAVAYQEPHPDICIETCKSLLEGMSKTIIQRLDPTTTIRQLEELDLEPLVKRSANLLRANDEQFETDFVNRCGSLAKTLGRLRNSRGDISHGRAVPKTVLSNKELAFFTLQMMESILLYMLHSFFSRSEQLEAEREKVDAYKDNPGFNNFLDELYPLDGKVLYSQALYFLYIEDYKIQLSDYLYEQELEEE